MADDIGKDVGYHVAKQAWCPNLEADVKLVKKLLNAHAAAIKLSPLLDATSKDCGARTRKAIEDFQQIVMRKAAPFGRVSPTRDGGKTLTALLQKPQSWDWTGDSAKWSQEQKLQSLHPTLREKIPKVLAALSKRGFQPTIFYAWRSVAEQLAIFNRGHSKAKFSFHNIRTPEGIPNSYAADIIDKRYGWDEKYLKLGFFEALGDSAKKHGLYWGGDWKKFRDVAHVQLVADAAVSSKLKAAQPK